MYQLLGSPLFRMRPRDIAELTDWQVWNLYARPLYGTVDAFLAVARTWAPGLVGGAPPGPAGPAEPLPAPPAHYPPERAARWLRLVADRVAGGLTPGTAAAEITRMYESLDDAQQAAAAQPPPGE